MNITPDLRSTIKFWGNLLSTELTFNNLNYVRALNHSYVLNKCLHLSRLLQTLLLCLLIS